MDALMDPGPGICLDSTLFDRVVRFHTEAIQISVWPGTEYIDGSEEMRVGYARIWLERPWCLIPRHLETVDDIVREIFAA